MAIAPATGTDARVSGHGQEGRTRNAFKEWAVTVAALEAGRQVLLLRKGGIREEGKEFRVEHDEFVLYPTYEHQRADLIKPEYHRLLERVLGEAQPGRFPVRSWARVTHVFETLDPAVVARLSSYGIWTADYAHERLAWKPRKPLYALVLRTYNLPETHWVDFDASYAGCRSWTELKEAIPLAGRAPALDDGEFARRVEEIRAIVEGGA